MEEIKKQDQVELFISSQLDKFEITPEDLQGKVDQYSTLTISGIEDKVGRKAVSEARKDLKNKRSMITNKGKELRDVPNKVSKAIIAREKELIAITQPEEQRLELMETDIAEEEEDIRQQKEYAEQQRIIARTKLIESYGASFNGVQYQLSDHTITITEVRIFTDAEFDRAATSFKWEFEQEKEKAEARQELINFRTKNANDYLYEIGLDPDKYDLPVFESDESLSEYKDAIYNKVQKEKDELESKRIAAEELKAERDRVAEVDRKQKAQQDEIDRKQKELDEKLAEIQKQKMKDAKAARQNQYAARRAVLLNTKTLLSQVVINDIDDSMYGLSEEGWNNLLLELTSEYKIWYDKRIKQEKDDAAAEEKRRIEMQPDIETLKQIGVDIKGTIVIHQMKSEKGKAVLSNINELKSKIVKYIEEQIKSL